MGKKENVILDPEKLEEGDTVCATPLGEFLFLSA